MRAAILETIGKIVLDNVDKPDIQSGDQVMIKVKAVGICGSEIYAFNGTHPYRIPPVILGHEASGIISEVGKDVTKVKVGDRVIIDPQWTCGVCEFCAQGDIN